MAAIILQDKWRRQPSGPVEIDRSNSFGALCAVAVTPQTIQGLRKSGFTLSGKEFLSAPRARDLAYYTDGASGYTAPWGRQVTGQALSFFGLISSQTTGTGLICAVSAGGGAGIGLAIWSNFAGTEYPALWHGSAGVFGSTAYQARNTPRFAVVTTNGSNSHNLYIDGRLVLSNTTAIGTFTSSWVVGVGVATSSVYSQVWQGAETSAALSGIINAELTPSAVLDLSSNPWQIFRKQPRILYFTAPSGGGATIAGDSGTYALTGSDVSLKAGRKLAADSGSYSLSGTDAAFKRGYALVASSGTYTVSGTAVSLKAGRKLAADSGSYTLTGTDATLTYAPAGSYNITAESGSYSLTGTAATLKVSRKLSADSGAYSLTGTTATLAKGVRMAAASGSYTLTGSNVSFARTYVLTAESGSYTLTGTSAGLTWSGAPVVVDDEPIKRIYPAGGARIDREIKELLAKQDEQIRSARLAREDEEIICIMALMAA